MNKPRKTYEYRKGGYVTNTKGTLRIITINVPTKYLSFIDKCVEYGLHPSRSEYIRDAIENQLKDDFQFMDRLDYAINEFDNVEFDPTKYVRIPGYNGNKPVKILKRLD